MNEHNLEKGLSRLESISAEFDYDKTQQYVQLAKLYLRSVREKSPMLHFFDESGSITVELPQKATDRLELFFRRKHDYAPTTQKVGLSGFLCQRVWVRYLLRAPGIRSS